MRSYLIMAILLLSSFLSVAQRTEADKYPAEKGDITVQPILHGTLMLQWDGKTIFVDPYGGNNAFAGLPKPDIILITDIHGDHLNQETLEALDTRSTKFVVPKAVYDKLPSNMQENAEVINNGGLLQIAGIPISALPMYNLPETDDSRHPKGRGNGYIVTLGGKQIYISGDTEDIPEMRSLSGIDIAFVCMNLPYTMSVDQAADAVLDFKPKVVYPFHYRGQGGLADVNSFRKKVLDSNNSIDVRLRNWYPEY